MNKRQRILTTLITCTFAVNCSAGISAKKVLSQTGVKGGLVVCINCDDRKFLAGLAGSESYLVHGLHRDVAVVRESREYLAGKGLYGRATAEQFAGTPLPYNDNIVNLLVVEDLGDVAMDEIMRVLSPEGVAYLKSAEGWGKKVKPRPAEIDEWTHFLRDASNNAVARDRKIATPNHLQWQAEPGRTRDHDAQASISAMTSSNGRIFYVIDEGLTSMIHQPPSWKLVGRDAFNGKLLWKRDIDSWITPLRYFRSGPVQLPRRLVSIGDKVYATLGFDAPVSVLDAATGKTIRKFRGSKKTEELICHEGVMIVVVGEPEVWNKHAPMVDNYWEFYDQEGPTPSKRIIGYDMDSGRELWTVKGENLKRLAPLSLTAGGDKAFYLDNENLYCVELKTGQERWKAEFKTKGLFLRNYAPTVVSYKDTVACLSLERLAIFSTKDGKKLWENKGYAGFASPGDLFVINDTVWTFPGTQAIRVKPGDVPGGGKEFLAFDLYTGKVKKSISKKEVWPTGHHHRCYRNKATERYLISSRRGLEFVDLEGNDNTINWWVRSICQYGFMPCNGLVYAAPHPCQCFTDYKFDGFNALAAEKPPEPIGGERLTKGPAFGTVKLNVRQTPASDAASGTKLIWAKPLLSGDSEDWPTYRHDITRSGCASTKVPVNLKKKWKAKIGGRLSSIVVARGKLLVASIDRQMLYCLGAENGEELWNFTAAGRIDSPPTIYGDMAVFGSLSGHVYALRLSDGEMVWFFRAAPDVRRTVVRDRLESLWPVHGSVLAVDGTVYFAAGRTSYLDGGIRLFAIEAESGRVRHQATLTSEASAQTGALNDVFVSDGRTIAMRNRGYDMSLQSGAKSGANILRTPNGLLNDSWGHRHRWNWTLGAADTFGKFLVFDAESAYGVQAYYTFLKHDQSMHPGTHTGHLHQKYSRYTPEQFPIGTRLFARANIEQKSPSRGKRGPKPKLSNNAHKWNRKMPLQFRALVLADDVLLGAGWKDSVRAFDKNPKETSESVLAIISTEDGRTIKEYPLKSEPVFDGMAAARGKVYLAQKDGAVLCLAAE